MCFFSNPHRNFGVVFVRVPCFQNEVFLDMVAVYLCMSLFVFEVLLRKITIFCGGGVWDGVLGVGGPPKCISPQSDPAIFQKDEDLAG